MSVPRPIRRHRRELAAPQPAARASLLLRRARRQLHGRARLRPGERWADRLAAGAARGHPALGYHNLAVDGATSADVLEQVGGRSQLEPDLVTVICGANDVLRSVRPDVDGYARAARGDPRRPARAAAAGARSSPRPRPRAGDFLELRPRTQARVERRHPRGQRGDPRGRRARTGSRASTSPATRGSTSRELPRRRPAPVAARATRAPRSSSPARCASIRHRERDHDERRNDEHERNARRDFDGLRARRDASSAGAARSPRPTWSRSRR